MKLRSLFSHTVSYTEDTWQDGFAHEPRFLHKAFYLMIIRTPNTCSPLLYEIKDTYISHSNLLDEQLFKTYQAFMTALPEHGIHCYQISNGKCLSHEVLPNKHPTLYDADACEMVLYQTYGLEPAEAHRKEKLQQNLKKNENLQQSLVYQCYINDTAHILEAVKKATKRQLNEKLEYVGTPLGICAENDNLEAFQAIAEKGADLNKQSLSSTPLAIAFTYSPAIVHYIYEHYPAQFAKEIKKQGFTIACKTNDISLLQLILASGADINGANKPFPPLHNFADFNNTLGIRFLLDAGADRTTLNKYKQTALQRAENRGNEEAAALLRSYKKAGEIQ